MKITPAPEEENKPKYPVNGKHSVRIPKTQTTNGMMHEPFRSRRPQRLGGIAIDLDKLEDYYPKKKKSHNPGR